MIQLINLFFTPLNPIINQEIALGGDRKYAYSFQQLWHQQTDQPFLLAFH